MRVQKLCEQAVRASPDADVKKYVEKKWLAKAPWWANPCKAWHRKLKAGAGLKSGQVATHGISGMVLKHILFFQILPFKVLTMFDVRGICLQGWRV